jgi:hypothetical protein
MKSERNDLLKAAPDSAQTLLGRILFPRINAVNSASMTELIT